MSARFSIQVEELDGAAVLALHGELDLARVGEVEAELERIEATHAGRRVVLDLRPLTFLDSSGLRLVVKADARSRRQGNRLTVVRGQAQVQHVFEITGMDRELAMVDDPSDTAPPEPPGQAT